MWFLSNHCKARGVKRHGESKRRVGDTSHQDKGTASLLVTAWAGQWLAHEGIVCCLTVIPWGLEMGS